MASNGTTTTNGNHPKDAVWISGPYNLEAIAGKGKGLIADEDIKPGSCILQESPLFTTESITSLETQERDLAKILKGLSKDAQRAFLSLHNNNPGREPLSNIVRSNAYPLGPGATVGGLFPTIARINHSCHPNSQQAWNSLLRKETVYAVRPIAKGEEITVSYSVGGASADRRAKLKEYFGFECTCEICSLPPEQLRISDARQKEAQRLDEAIGDPKTVNLRPEKALADCHKLEKLFQEEGIADTRLQRLYFDAFQICAMHGDAARARIFAQKSRDARVLFEGEGGPEVLAMLPWIKDPTRYENFSAKGKWKSSTDRVPKDIGPQNLEKWLWREK